MRGWLPQRPLRWRLPWLIIGWMLVGGVVWVSLTPRLPVPDVPLAFLDKAGHFTAYFILMAWYAFLYLRPAHRWIAVALVLLGVALEGAQHISGYRMFEVGDIIADSVGVAFGFLLARTRFERLLQWVEGRLT